MAREPEEVIERDRTPRPMLIVPAALLLAAIAVGLIPGAVSGIETAAAHLRDHAVYAGWVLRSIPPHYAPTSHSRLQGETVRQIVHDAAAMLMACGLTDAARTLRSATSYSA